MRVINPRIMYEDNEEAHQSAQQLDIHRVYHILTLLISILLSACSSMLQTHSVHTWEPYHTSILTSEAQVLELLSSHPKCICCEIGVSHKVFLELIGQLCQLGYNNSK